MQSIAARSISIILIATIGQAAAQQSVIDDFCESAISVDRGFALESNVGPTFGNIKSLFAQEAFRQSCDIAVFPHTLARRVHDLIPSDQDNDLDVEPYDGATGTSKELRKELCDDLVDGLAEHQIALIPYICLRLEGLMALRRAEFRDLVGVTRDQQVKIGSSGNLMGGEFS